MGLEQGLSPLEQQRARRGGEVKTSTLALGMENSSVGIRIRVATFFFFFSFLTFTANKKAYLSSNT